MSYTVILSVLINLLESISQYNVLHSDIVSINKQHAHRFFHLGVHVPFYLHFCGYINIFGGTISNSSFGGTKKMNCIFPTQGRAPCCFFVNITQSWRKLFFSVWHWVRQEVGFCLTHGLCVCPTILFVILYITCQNFVFLYRTQCKITYI